MFDHYSNEGKYKEFTFYVRISRMEDVLINTCYVKHLEHTFTFRYTKYPH